MTHCTCEKYELKLEKSRSGVLIYEVIVDKDEYHGKGCCFTICPNAPNNGLIAENWKKE